MPSRRFTVFSFAVWFVAFACTFAINLKIFDGQIIEMPVNPIGHIIIWSLEQVIFSWLLYFGIGIETRWRIYCGGAIFGILVALNVDFDMLNRIANYRPLPIRYFGQLISDDAGNVTSLFWLIIVLHGLMGFSIYAIPAWIANKLIPHKIERS